MNRNLGACLVAFLAVSMWGCAASGGTTSATVIEHQPTAIELHEAAIALAARGDLTRAEQYASMAVGRGLPIEDALPLLLRVCLASARVSAALAHAEPVLRAHPQDHELRYLVATMYFALNRRADATRELGQVLRDAPTHDAARRVVAELEGLTP